MRKGLPLVLATCILAVTPAAAEPAQHLVEYAQAKTPDGFRHDAVTLTWWHLLAIACPFERRDVDDLDFAGMMVLAPEDAPRITPDMQAAIDREAQAMVERALERDKAGTCRDGARDMRADTNARFDAMEREEQSRHR